MRSRPFLCFFLLSGASFIVATAGSDVIAQVSVNDWTMYTAFTEHLRNATLELEVWLYGPFLGLGCLAAAVAKWKGFDRGLAIFLLGALLLGFVYFNGFVGAQQALNSRKWTAAALSIGLLPFLSVPILLLCSLVSLLMPWKADEKN